MKEYKIGSEFTLLSITRYEEIGRTVVYVKCASDDGYTNMEKEIRQFLTSLPFAENGQISIGSEQWNANRLVDVTAINTGGRNIIGEVYLLFTFSEILKGFKAEVIAA